MTWISVKDELPDIMEHVITICPKMGANGETEILVAQMTGENEWYSGFPNDQPVEVTHWCYKITAN